MATVTVYPAVDGGISSTAVTTAAATSFAAARNGTGSLVANTTATNHIVGHTGTTDFVDYYTDVYELFLSFDTSTVVGTISNVALSMVAVGITMDNFPGINEVRTKDWGATLETTDFVAGANLAALTLVASWDRATGYTSGTRYTFISEAAFVGSINQSGFSRYMVSSSKTRLNVMPGYTMNGEWAADSFYVSERTGTTEDPTLVITTGTTPVGAWGAIQN